MTSYFCHHALLPEGWRRDVRFDVCVDGRITAVHADAEQGGATLLGRYVLPGMPNLHSHAFQRAMAGQVEGYGRADDSFWTWRETMYAQAERMDPERLYRVACWLYLEMLQRGYTRVCEFHYLHHQPDGRPYAPATAMADALIAAAADSGIGLTLLPTLYQRGGFDDRALTSRQRRFGHDLDAYVRLLDDLASKARGGSFRLGVAIHSLRAVADAQIQSLLQLPQLARAPIHIHIAEQRAEVEDCLATHGRRPIEHLYDVVTPDSRFCLVHATHPSSTELDLMARSPVVVGLCPSTEANLGDGEFPLAQFRAAGGRYGIGSDSHIGLDPREELRWLEYQARLASGRRAVLANASNPDVATNLWREAVAGGAQASGAAAAGFAVGADADWIVLDDDDPALAGHDQRSILAGWMFGPNRGSLRAVGVAGRQVLERGRHPREREFADAFRSSAQKHQLEG